MHQFYIKNLYKTHNSFIDNLVIIKVPTSRLSFPPDRRGETKDYKQI